MAIREITYTLSPSGISPAAEQFGGIQGDHRATKLTFKFNGDLVAALNDYDNLRFRFDAYDGEGNVCQTEGELSADNSLEYFLEERLTRAGGKVAVVLVCTEINDSAETKLELYNFPALLRLKNKPQGNGETSENRESYTTLLEAAKNAADSAKAIADAVSTKVTLFEGDELTIPPAGEMILTTINSNSQLQQAKAGDLYRQDGELLLIISKGEQPDIYGRIQTNILYMRLISYADSEYNPESSNAQSGTAVAEAIRGIDISEVDLSGKMDKFGNFDEDGNLIVSEPFGIKTENGSLYGVRFENGVLTLDGANAIYINGHANFGSANFNGEVAFDQDILVPVVPTHGDAAASKKYVDDGLLTKQNTLISGENIKTINNQSLVGSGNIDISGGGGSVIINQTSDKITPLFIPIIPDFNWVSVREIAAFSANNEKFADGTEDGNNAYFKVTGNAGDNYVTVVNGGNAEMSDLTTAEQSTVWGAVLKYDNGHYVPCNAKYKDANSFYVYPALTEDITDGELGNIQVGIHLTKRGYIAYAQHAFNANPKHCEKNKYIAKYRPVAGESAPFTTFGGRTYTSVGKVNVMEEIQNKYAYAVWAMSMQWENSFHTTPSGMTWQVETNGENGYVEVYVGANPLVADPMGDLLDGEEIYVEIWLDGVLSQQYVKKSTYCERVCLDFAGATIAELKVYSNTWNRYKYGFNIGAVTWWVNERYLDSNTNPFKFKAITQLFDSWGVFQNEAVKTELERLNKELSGVYVPITNSSKGSQTSVWGRAYFYEKVQKTNPTVMITDFGINDANSIAYPQLPETITGTDGSVYDNNLTSAEYAQSMVDLINMAIANNIQPIVFGIGWRSGNGNNTLPSWYMSTIDLWSTEYELY